MSVHAGTIVTVAGRTVLQRVQSSGLGNVTIPKDTIREVGNELVVDKVPQEPDFTFTLESLDVSCDIEALLHGKRGDGGGGGSDGAAENDPDGTEYPWETSEAINVASPWKDHATGSAGHVAAGHLIPGFYPTSIAYRFGVTDNAQTTVELAGGAFYYGEFAPVEEQQTVAGGTVTSSDPAIRYRKGGAAGTTFKSVFGVISKGKMLIEGYDYNVAGGAAAPGSPVTLTFTPESGVVNGDTVRLAYFTSASRDYPQSVHRSALVLPGAVRGRHVCVSISPVTGPESWKQIYNAQSAELTATFDTAVERELCNEESVGRTINGVDTNGNVVVRSRDYDAFFELLRDLTGIDVDAEVVGFINQNPVKLKIEIKDPRNPGNTIKTLYVKDAQFDIPGTPARVNTPTDFSLGWSAQSGTYSAFKGSRADNS
jgi:hypothetical protein